jgi:hypothetical protein
MPKNLMMPMYLKHLLFLCFHYYLMMPPHLMCLMMPKTLMFLRL